MFKSFFEGKHIEMFMHNALYDPKYGIHEAIEDMSVEHRCCIEDMICSFPKAKDPEEQGVDTCVAVMKDEGKYEWYFAIGAMMNFTSITNRGVFPKESIPAEVQDYELIFIGSLGMGAANPCEGKSFHGVLHKVSVNHMKMLDEIEGAYARLPAKCILYDGTEMDCSIYTDSKGMFDRTNDKPPSERYIEIMCDGAEMFGVKLDYINMLKQMEVVPRPNPKDLKSFEVPENAPVWSMQDLKNHPMHYAVNGKVIQREYLQNKPPTMNFFKKGWEGKHCELSI